MTIHIAIWKDRGLFSQLFEPVSQVLCLQEAFADAMSLIPQALRGERILCLQLAGRKPRRHGTKERLLVLPEMSCDVFDELCPFCLTHGDRRIIDHGFWGVVDIEALCLCKRDFLPLPVDLPPLELLLDVECKDRQLLCGIHLRLFQKDQCELLGQILIESLPDGIIGELSKKRLEICQELTCRFRIPFLICFCEADVFLISVLWSCFGIHFYPPNSVRRRPSQTVTTFWKYYD